MEEHGGKDNQVYRVKIVLNIVAVPTDGSSVYQVYLDDCMNSPHSFLLGEDEDVGIVLDRIANEHIFTNPDKMYIFVEARKTKEDQLTLYYSLAIMDTRIKNGKWIPTNDLNSEILRKTLMNIRNR